MRFFLNLDPHRSSARAFEGGAALLPMIVAIMFLMVVVAPRAIGRCGFKTPIVAVLLILAVGMALLRGAGMQFRRRRSAGVADCGDGHGPGVHPLPRQRHSAARPEEGGLASGIVYTADQVGSALGLAAMTGPATAQGATIGHSDGAHGRDSLRSGAAGIAVVGDRSPQRCSGRRGRPTTRPRPNESHSPRRRIGWARRQVALGQATVSPSAARYDVGVPIDRTERDIGRH